MLTISCAWVSAVKGQSSAEIPSDSALTAQGKLSSERYNDLRRTAERKMRLHNDSGTKRFSRQAIRIFSRLIEERPVSDPEIWLLRARAYTKLGLHSESFQDAKRYSELVPEDFRGWKSCADMAVRLRNYPMAGRYYQIAADTESALHLSFEHSFDAALYYYLGDAYAESLNLLEHMRLHQCRLAEIDYYQGRVLAAIGANEQAATLLERAYANRNGGRLIMRALIRDAHTVYKDLGNTAKVEEWAERWEFYNGKPIE
ncbi:MAG: hypothetical protein AAF570_20530 [Bacteroidota bacterium]